MNCKQCNNEFQEVNNIQKFCSLKCKNTHNNKIYQTYSNQKDKGIIRKLELIAMKGNKCEMCGYNKNYTALCFHHLNPDTKLFKLDARNCSNKKFETLLIEANKCQLLCHNCHMEIHYPDAILT